MDRAVGEIPEQPRINGAKCEFAAFRSRLSVGDIIQNPSDFSCGEVSVDWEPSLVRYYGFESTSFQGIAKWSGPAALPYYCIGDRLPGAPFPNDRCFTLVSYANRVKLARANFSGIQKVVNGVNYGVENLAWVVFNPARLRIYLRDFLVGLPDDLTPAVHQQGGGACRSLVNCKYVTR